MMTPGQWRDAFAGIRYQDYSTARDALENLRAHLDALTAERDALAARVRFLTDALETVATLYENYSAAGEIAYDMRCVARAALDAARAAGGAP